VGPARWRTGAKCAVPFILVVIMRLYTHSIRNTVLSLFDTDYTATFDITDAVSYNTAPTYYYHETN